MSEYYSGNSLYVREVKKRGGGVHYGLFRPWGGCMDVFESRELANLVAEFIDRDCAGTYVAQNRKAARIFAENVLKEKQDGNK